MVSNKIRSIRPLHQSKKKTKKKQKQNNILTGTVNILNFNFLTLYSISFWPKF